jgi:hypothetical protein
MRLACVWDETTSERYFRLLETVCFEFAVDVDFSDRLDIFGCVGLYVCAVALEDPQQSYPVRVCFYCFYSTVAYCSVCCGPKGLDGMLLTV